MDFTMNLLKVTNSPKVTMGSLEIDKFQVHSSFAMINDISVDLNSDDVVCDDDVLVKPPRAWTWDHVLQRKEMLRNHNNQVVASSAVTILLDQVNISTTTDSQMWTRQQ